jgi:hypothetical protein
MEGILDENSNYEGATGGWESDPDLVSINEERPPPAELLVSEEDIKKIWQNLMLYLCQRHRINKRNGRQTDYRIEDLRKDHYGVFTDHEYFRRLLSQLARQYKEVEVERHTIRLSKFGLDNCEKYDPTFQRDF